MSRTGDAVLPRGGGGVSSLPLLSWGATAWAVLQNWGGRGSCSPKAPPFGERQAASGQVTGSFWEG